MATTPDQIQTRALGKEGEPCAACATPLAADQRYCLNCGQRRGPLRLPYEAYLARPQPAAAATVTAERPARDDPSPLGAVLGVALLGGMLLIGVLLGRGQDDQTTTTTVTQQPTAASAVPPVTTETQPAEPTTTEAAPPAAEPLVSEWPAGQAGFTVQLATFPKDDAAPEDIAAEKQDAESAGAGDVGVLDSDLYSSIPGGDWVVYAGVFDSKAAAERTLGGLTGDYPDAEVIAVSPQGAPGKDEK
jgi:hypothetical protein